MKIYTIIGGVDGTGKREDVRRRYTERFDSLLDVMPLCNEIFSMIMRMVLWKSVGTAAVK